MLQSPALLLYLEGGYGFVPLALFDLLGELPRVRVLDLQPHADAAAYDLLHRGLYRLGVGVVDLDPRDAEDLVEGHVPDEVDVGLARALGYRRLLHEERRRGGRTHRDRELLGLLVYLHLDG